MLRECVISVKLQLFLTYFSFFTLENIPFIERLKITLLCPIPPQGIVLNWGSWEVGRAAEVLNRKRKSPIQRQKWCSWRIYFQMILTHCV